MVRNPSDLVGVIGCLLGIGVVCLMVVYAHNTTEGMAVDVQAFSALLQRILFLPVRVLDLIVILFPPIVVGLDLLLKRYPMAALHGLIGAAGSIVINAAVVFLIREWAPASLLTGLSVDHVVTVPSYVSAITGLLTAAATPVRRRSVVWSWNLMWIAVVVAVVTSADALAGVGVALLIGRMVGYAVRYGLGVASHRAYGSNLIDGIRRAGFSPVTLDRVSPVPVAETGATAPGVQSPQFFADHRLYVMRTVSGRLYNVIVLDGDRQVMSVLTRVWRYLRSRAIEGASAFSLRQTAERTALLSYAVRSAGVNTPAVLAIAEAEDSMLIVREATSGSVCFADLDQDAVSDELLDAMWSQVLKAHRCSIVHRALTPQCFRISGTAGSEGHVSVLGWEAGDLAASDLTRRVDLTQMLALTTTKVSPQRAVAAAGRALNAQDLASVAPLLQVPAVPKPTRDRMDDPKQMLSQLRTELSRGLPDVSVQPEQISRVRVRTIVMAVFLTMAAIAILTTFNLSQVMDALRQSDWRWAVASFVIGLVGFAGSALALIAFSPVKLPFWKVCAGQVAASFVALAAPAGLGSAAVNLQMLLKKNVAAPIATATVALVQVTTAVITALALLVMTVITGSSQRTSFQVSPGMLIAVLVVAAVVAAILLIPRTRAWVQAKVMPLLRQTWPRLVELFSSPLRLLLGVAGNLIMLVCYITALQWAVFAFKQSAPLLGTTMVYLVGTSAGSIVPTPGGIGTIEVTESATLASVGINAGVAMSIIILFRVVTYWIRIPLGWIAYRLMRRHDEL